MKPILLVVSMALVLVLISCSHSSKETKETIVEEEEIGCLCCPVEEALADSITPDANK